MTPLTGLVTNPVTPLPTPFANPSKPYSLAPYTGLVTTPVTP